ncbi:MAG: GntR family transcriptional regulator [Acidobacteriaceae bacterium]|nr:GntR family transcriptional regulator [Acidobacteriaceae bacterium]
MQLFVSASDELPIYRQLMRQITDAIAVGRLKPGEKLPSHRELAEQLIIAPLTVKKAYDELEAAGFIETQRGRGTFIAERFPKRDAVEQKELLDAVARQFLSRAYLAGFDLSGALKLLREADRQLTSDSVPDLTSTRRRRE